jgi:hypothetical protein
MGGTLVFAKHPFPHASPNIDQLTTIYITQMGEAHPWVSVGERLSWASANGSLEAPGLAPATGKNFYH